MRIDKEEMKRLAEKSDAELWAEIQALAKNHGYNIPASMPKHEDIEKVRRALLGVEKIKLSDAAKIMKGYNKNK